MNEAPEVETFEEVIQPTTFDISNPNYELEDFKLEGNDIKYTHQEFIDHAKVKALEWTQFNSNANHLTIDDVYVVWSVKALQNSKVLLATDNADGLYFEATLNGNKNEFYFDVYSKVANRVVTKLD